MKLISNVASLALFYVYKYLEKNIGKFFPVSIPKYGLLLKETSFL